jgi:hypothetical protein
VVLFLNLSRVVTTMDGRINITSIARWITFLRIFCLV